MNSFVEFFHSLHADVCIPHAAISQSIKVELLMTAEQLKHYFDSIAAHTGKNIRRICGKRIRGETKFSFIPTYRRADVGHRKSRHRTDKFEHQSFFLLRRKSDRAVTYACGTFVERWFYFPAFRQIHGDRANNTL